MGTQDSEGTIAARTQRLARAVGRRILGRGDDPANDTESPDRLSLAEALRLRDELAGEVPETLARALAAGPLAADDPRLIDREKPREALLAALEAWRAGRPALAAVTGPIGSGITTLVGQLAAAAQPGEQVRSLRLTARPADAAQSIAQCAALFELDDPPGTLDALVARVRALEPSIVVLDDGHMLASRIMGSTQAIRTLGALMVATHSRHLWVVGCHEPAWRRLAYAHEADRFFTHTVALEYFSEDELAAALRARLVAAGALAPAGEDDARALPESIARRLGELRRASGGHPELAFFHLLHAISRDPRPGALELGPLTRLDLGALDRLALHERLALAELAVHGELTVAEHRGIFRCSAEDSWILLEHLCRGAIVECVADAEAEAVPAAAAGEAARYRLVSLFASAVIAHLEKTNFLY